MIENFITSIESVDEGIEVKYFSMKMFDNESVVIQSDVCIGHIDELDEYLLKIREAYLLIFPIKKESE